MDFFFQHKKKIVKKISHVCSSDTSGLIFCKKKNIGKKIGARPWNMLGSLPYWVRKLLKKITIGIAKKLVVCLIFAVTTNENESFLNYSSKAALEVVADTVRDQLLLGWSS